MKIKTTETFSIPRFGVSSWSVWCVLVLQEISEMSKQKRQSSKKVSSPKAATEQTQHKPFESSFDTPSTSSTQTKHSQEQSADGSLLGYIKNVSPLMITKNAKKSEYFTFQIQEKNRTTKALCFSPQKHKANVDRKAQSGSPCKVTKYAPHKDEEDVVWINNYTRIDEAQETAVDFEPRNIANQNTQELHTTTSLDTIKPNQSVNVRGFLLFGDAQIEKVKDDLEKKEGYLVDEQGAVKITIWNDQIQQVTDNFYDIKDIHVKKYLGEVYLSCSKTTTFKLITENTPVINSDAMKEAKEQLINTDVLCSNIWTMVMNEYYSCLTCTRRVQTRPGSSMLRCMYCQSRFLSENSKKTFNARLELKIDGEQNSKWYTLFSTWLSKIVECYNQEKNKTETLDSVDHDELCEFTMECLKGRLTLKVNQRDIVVGITIA